MVKSCDREEVKTEESQQRGKLNFDGKLVVVEVEAPATHSATRREWHLRAEAESSES